MAITVDGQGQAGTPLVLDISERTANGGNQADVFRRDGLVYKLFRNDAGRGNASREPDERRRKKFDSEFEAYKIASGSRELRRITPKFHRAVEVASVYDSRGGRKEDLTAMYLLDCCLVMDWIKGPYQRYGDIKRQCPHLLPLIELFHDAGIGYVERDATVFFYDDIERVKFIDFRTAPC